MRNKLFFLVVIVFGLTMLSIPTHAMEVEGAYCKFDIKKWRDRQTLWDFLKNGSDCEIVIDAEDWGEIKIETEFEDDLKALREFLGMD